ncbi:thiamine phosphate synthase [Aquimarina intermedia]|uniref:Thiamine-phosphate diphosphorylase n=1 Tax=Aquimarina intermedia TaxID=350814 RepID=A0A5S5C799_9FLAO|nr:thiamine phosphate synthase [Aquimarina intermedia]TYP75285.1 thiamine-phosphate diphosphorylase [Aquimarina intermedia]
MIIPKLHYITQGNTSKEHLENIQKACTSGIELVRLGIDTISDKKFLKLAKEAREITAHFQTRLIITDKYNIAKEVAADGIYLERETSYPSKVRKHLYSWQSIGAAANTLQTCQLLLDEDVDYIVLAPFSSLATKSNPAQELDVKGFADITKALHSETPIIGMGRISIDEATALLETGISGIAVSDEITKNFNSIRTYNQLLNASSTAEQRHTFK